jgi:type IV secretion system protein VirD4
VLQCRWSQLVSIRTWDDARRIVGRMALPAREAAPNGATTGSSDVHFLDRARDWLEVLLHAAKLSHRPISDVADWGATDTARRHGRRHERNARRNP